MSLYESLLKKGNDAISDLKRPFKVKAERKNLEMKILELEQEIAESNLTIQTEKTKHPIDWDKLIDAIDDNDINNRKLKQLKDLEKELFLTESEDE